MTSPKGAGKTEVFSGKVKVEDPFELVINIFLLPQGIQDVLIMTSPKEAGKTEVFSGKAKSRRSFESSIKQNSCPLFKNK
jgi:hypothetical protein